MARGVNRVILIGNLGGDPVVKKKGDFTVANISIATSESWTDKATGEKKQDTQWHRIVIYNKLAEIVEKYVRKGDKIYIEGKIKSRKYTDDKGIERFIMEIIAHEMQMLGNKKQENSQEEENPYLKPRSSSEAQHTDNQQQFDDDIPF